MTSVEQRKFLSLSGIDDFCGAKEVSMNITLSATETCFVIPISHDRTFYLFTSVNDFGIHLNNQLTIVTLREHS